MSHTDVTHDVVNAPLEVLDPAIAEVLRAELSRQRQTLEMIASENFAPRAVLECQGSVLTNKYAEGYPPARRPMPPCSTRCSSRATRSWGSSSRTAAISRTA